MYLLDTNICIFLKNKKPPHVLYRFKQAIDKGVYISSITVAELQFGVYNSIMMERNRVSLVEFLAPFTIIDYTADDAECLGRIRSRLKKEGRLIGPYDMLIASQAIARNFILVTNNTDEFSRLRELRIEDWS